MVSRKQAEQRGSGSAKQKDTDQEAAKPRQKAGKAPTGSENLKARPAAEADTGTPAPRKPAAGKKTVPPAATSAEEATPKTPARKSPAKAQATPTPAPKKAAARPAKGKTAKEPPTPPPAGKSSSAKKTEAPAKPAPAETGRPAASRRSTAKPAAKPAAGEPEKPTRARPARRIDAADANARPESQGGDDKPARRPTPRTAKPAAAEMAVTPAALEQELMPPHREAAPPASAAVPEAALPRETPAAIGATRIVLMIRDPEWLYAYWEISDTDRQAHAIGQPQGAPPLLLRVYDLGVEAAQPVASGNFFDVTVLPDASGWYVHIPLSGGHWGVALGYLNYEGELVVVASSNVVTTPSPIHAAWNEQTWGPVSEEQHRAEAAGSAGVEIEEEVTTPGGPSRLVRRATRLMSYLKGSASEQVPRMGASEQVPRLGASEQVPRMGASEQLPLRPGASEQAPRIGASEQFAAPGSGLMGQRYEVGGEKGKTFWLQVYTELIVYGATEPDASVTVQGQPIRLRPDGTFTLRFALPDGEQVIPVRAVNFDGDMERTITPIVTKRTV